MLGSFLFTLAFAAALDVASVDDGPTMRLSWEAPAGCPDESRVRAEILRRARELGPVAASKPVGAQGAIRRDPSGEYRLNLKTSVGAIAGERDIAGRDCAQLADAAALVLAMLFHPETTPAVIAAPVPPPPKQNIHLGLGIDTVLAHGVLPQTGTGLALRGILRRGPWMAEVAFTGFLPAGKQAPLLPGAKADFQRLESALHLCTATPVDRRLGAAACVGGALVRLRGQSVGVSDAGHATAYWPEAIVTGAGSLALTPAVRLRLATAIHALGGRPDFAILGLGSIYRPAAYHVRGLLGIDLLF